VSYKEVKVKGKFVPVLLTEHHAMKTYWASGGIAPRILELGTRCWSVTIFTLRPLYPQGKSPWNPSDRRLGGPQNLSGRGGEEKNSQPLQELEPPTFQLVTQRYTTELSRLYHIRRLIKIHLLKDYNT
jgi:hypothetical protein